jgi:hypothetical protein
MRLLMTKIAWLLAGVDQATTEDIRYVMRNMDAISELWNRERNSSAAGGSHPLSRDETGGEGAAPATRPADEPEEVADAKDAKDALARLGKLFPERKDAAANLGRSLVEELASLGSEAQLDRRTFRQRAPTLVVIASESIPLPSPAHAYN